MGLSVSASRSLWPSCGYGPQQHRLGLTGTVHNALWCTSNCPDISLNWANALPALQSALLSLSLSLLSPLSPKAWTAYPEMCSVIMKSANIISAWLFFFFSPYSPQMFLIRVNTHTLNSRPFVFVLTKAVVLWLLHSLTLIRGQIWNLTLIQLCVKCRSNLCHTFLGLQCF